MSSCALYRVKLAVHKETSECVAVKIIHVNDSGGGCAQECLKKEVSTCRTSQEELEHVFATHLYGTLTRSLSVVNPVCLEGIVPVWC